MPAIVLIGPYGAGTRLPPRRRLILSQSIGIGHIRNWREDGYLDRADPSAFGISAAVEERVDAWVAEWAKAGDGLPYPYSPEHCRDVDIEDHASQGRLIAGDIADCLPDDWVVSFTPVPRKDRLYKSQIIETIERGRLRPVPPACWGDGAPVLSSEAAQQRRWVRVMADGSQGALWDQSGTARDADDYGLPSSLVDALDRWSLDHERLWFGATSAPNFWALKEAAAAMARFAAHGHDLALQVKAALGADWTVVYHDPDLAERHAYPERYERVV